MRALAIACALLLLPPLAAAHDGSSNALTHLSIQDVTLQPGENTTVWIETGEGPWKKGMVFVINGFMLEGSRLVQVELIYNHSRVAVNEWSFVEEDVIKGTSLIPHDQGPYELRFTNHASNATRFRFFFDQSCECTAKPIGLNEGVVVFAYDLQKNRRYHLGVPLREGEELKGEMATVRGIVGDLEDFDVYERRVAVGPNWLNFSVVPPESRTYYFFYTALAGAKFRSQDTLIVTVLVEETAGRSPGFGWAVLLAAAALASARRRR